jgi:hypothetical protein
MMRKEFFMFKFIQVQRFAKRLFDDEDTARKASRIMLGILAAKSPRISQIADEMPGEADANYKMIQRFLKSADLKTALQRFFDVQANFVIGDPTEIERAHARKTAYVGQLTEGQIRGFWLLTLATPIRGRALPCNFLTYSSATLGSESSSRNLEHQRAIAEIRTTIGSRPVVFDREFSYLTFFKYLAGCGMQFVIRLNQGSKPPKFYYDADKREELTLLVAPGSDPKIYRDIYYKGEVKVNVIGIWKTGMPKPLWIITNMDPEIALEIYLQRMKIEMKFRDLKSIFRIETIMNKSKFYLDQMLALLLITYAISVLIGEAIRDVRYGGITVAQLDLHTTPEVPDNSSWYLYSGVFVLLRQRRRLCHATLRKIVSRVFATFSALIGEYPVRSFVRT